VKEGVQGKEYERKQMKNERGIERKRKKTEE